MPVTGFRLGWWEGRRSPPTLVVGALWGPYETLRSPAKPYGALRTAAWTKPVRLTMPAGIVTSRPSQKANSLIHLHLVPLSQIPWPGGMRGAIEYS